jgi:hypothetical protein
MRFIWLLVVQVGGKLKNVQSPDRHHYGWRHCGGIMSAGKPAILLHSFKVLPIELYARAPTVLAVRITGAAARAFNKVRR